MSVWKKLRGFLRSWPRIRFMRALAVKLDWGRENIVSIKGRYIGSLRVKGDNNHVHIPASTTFTGHIFVHGNNIQVTVGENCRLVADIVVKGSNQSITIGEGTTFASVYLLCLERSHIRIGRWCMFSREIEVRTSDAHSLISSKTGKRLNAAGSVTIGDHVWVGVGAIINKGTTIADDCVVGAKSFVNKPFAESGVVIAGAPAKIVKSGVTWHRGRKRKFSRAEMDVWRQPPSDT
jgi:acetyltransferase-like isoleucine patch superfamily enzyme